MVDTEGVQGRTLVQLAGDVVTFPLRLDGPATLRGRVRLFPADWRDGTGAVEVAATVVRADGSRWRVWSRLLGAASAGGHADGVALECALPAFEHALVLTVSQVGAGNPRAVGRAMWLDVELGVHAPESAGPSAHERDAGEQGALSVMAGPEPLISVLTPVHDPPLGLLEGTIGSVTSQTFHGWELCLVDDGSRDPEIIAALQRHAAGDPRIRLLRHEVARGIAAATNAALELAAGSYVALLDHDDTLEPAALEAVAYAIARDPSLDMIYTDEDIVFGERRVWIHHKPAWSPDTLHTNGYTCHLGVYRRALVSEIGGFRTEFDGSQDVDMILRLVERSDRIHHIPQVLYHWQAHPESTAGGDAKPYAYVAARRAIAEHLARVQAPPARVEHMLPGLYRVDFEVDPALEVDVVLQASDAPWLRPLAKSLAEQRGVSWKLVLTADERALPACMRALEAAGITRGRVHAVPYPRGVTAADALARATAEAAAEHVVILEEAVVGLTHEWLRRIVGYLAAPSVVAAAPVVMSIDGRIAHAGVAFPSGFPLFLLYGTRPSMDSHFGYGTSVYDVSAVSGVVATTRTRLQAAGGLRPERESLMLVDYCTRACVGHERAVLVPDARVGALDPNALINDLDNLRRQQDEWLRTREGDPYFNPNFRSDRGDLVVARRD